MSEQHIVREGECIASIAFERGFYPDTIWNHPDNEALRAKREHGYSLSPGDVVVIPDKRSQIHACQTGRTHTFRRRGVPEKLKLTLVDDGKPRAGVEYVLVIDGQEFPGKTDAKGGLESWISPSATRAVLRVEGESELKLDLGFLHPVSTVDGVCFRLANLGFLRGEQRDEATLREALLAFQAQYELDETGEVSEETRRKLVDVHGS